MEHKKKLKHLKLVGLDSNAFALLGAFQKQAKREGWSVPEINHVIDKAQSGDYNNLVSTLMEHCENPAGGDDDDSCDRDLDE